MLLKRTVFSEALVVIGYPHNSLSLHKKYFLFVQAYAEASEKPTMSSLHVLKLRAFLANLSE